MASQCSVIGCLVGTDARGEIAPIADMLRNEIEFELLR
jgi:hypothetical protein